MPRVKKLFQESENSAKPEFIHGHMFGGLGILAGNIHTWACIPLSIRFHDGLQAAKGWKGASVFSASHVVRMRTWRSLPRQKSCTAFEKPRPRRPGRGGAAVHLKDLFVSHRGKFQEAEMETLW